MDETCQTAICSYTHAYEQTAETTDEPRNYVTTIAVPAVERVGMYVIQDDLPSESEMDDGGEFDRFMAEGRART